MQQSDRLDPPEHMWPAFALLGYRVAQLRRELWLSVGDGLWRLRLRQLAVMFYRGAVVADRDAHRIARDVRRCYEDVPDVVHEETLSAEIGRLLGRRP